MKKHLITGLTFFPLVVFAEGQYALGFFLDAIDFVKVFAIWAIVIFASIKIFTFIKPNKLDNRNKKRIWLATGLLALFIWSMIKHDPYPYSGPIDSIFKKKLTSDPNSPIADSTIEYTWSINKSEEGAYIWLNNKRIFVREFTAKERAHEGLNDSLTMSVVRGWKDDKNEKVETFNCPDFDFNSAEPQSDSLVAFMQKAQHTNLTDRIEWEQKFFCAFPSTFKGMQAVFGFDNKTGAAPLYHYPKGANVIKYFSQLEFIDDSLYYDKYIRINIDGIWEADNIGYAFHFDDHLLENTKEACKALSKFSDEEIKSVFRFIFDNPHPNRKYSQEPYEKLHKNIVEYDLRLSELLTESYETLMSEDHSH